MSAVWYDIGAAERAGRRWTLTADVLHRRAGELEHALAELALAEQRSAVRHLTTAAATLWHLAAIVRLTTGAVTSGDRSFDLSDHGDVGRLAATARAGASGGASSVFGDPGGTGSREVRRPYHPSGATPVARARSVLARALADTADPRQIRADEFQLVRLDNGRHVVVLPGVVDLSVPDPGWHDHHRSVRDLDRAAVRSSRSTGIEGNRYAELVRDGLEAAGVPPGAELLLVGHSFGADTALDLAADATFNGSTGFHVTHVVAAGYHSGPQLTDVPPATSVLVVQNRQDVAVIAEAVGAAHVADVFVEQAAAVRALAELDPRSAVRHQTATVAHQAGALWAAGRHLVRRADDVARVVTGVATGAPLDVHTGVTGLLTLEPGVTTPAPRQVVSVFDGGGDGFGHRQSHYVDHLRHTDDPAVVTFLESVDRAGYASPGVALAIDVSVPR